MAMTTLPEVHETPTPEAPRGARDRSRTEPLRLGSPSRSPSSPRSVLTVRFSSDADARPPRSAGTPSSTAASPPSTTRRHGGVDRRGPADRGSIAAIDHAATPSAARQWYSVEHGSITAIDHAAATAARRRPSVSAEPGRQPRPIDHAADGRSSGSAALGTRSSHGLACIGDRPRHAPSAGRLQSVGVGRPAGSIGTMPRAAGSAARAVRPLGPMDRGCLARCGVPVRCRSRG